MREIVCAFQDLHPGDLSKDFKIIGLSDANLIANYFENLLGGRYKNTFFDTAPKLDVSDLKPISFETTDVLISSDVFEHVFFPLSRALEGSYNLLKPGGRMICTMPWSTFQPSIEHFPWMTSYTVSKLSNEQYAVLGVDSTGAIRVVEEPIFHGGPGNTLEMRKINVLVLVEDLRKAGFVDIQIHNQDRPEFGIRRPDGVVGVVTAVKPKSEVDTSDCEPNGLLQKLKRIFNSCK